ncbi:MAG: hypothetical protein HY898_26130 [Deltaproteobacteria bacterium]|nr:hypothetical protein [Deltaproteobacteria bacterium]
MRRFLIALTLLAPWGLTGCEDGPDQPFSPAPEGAANKWNSPPGKGWADPAKQGYLGGGSTGTTKNEICTAPKKAERWAQMVQEPIIPPHGGGGIDLAGGDTWQGITIEEAEQINCQSSEAGDVFGDGTPVNYWGDNAEVWFSYSTATRKGLFMDFWPGYVGTIDAESREHEDPNNPGTMIKDKFKIYVNAQMTKNNEKYEISWFKGNFVAQVNEIGEALLATYAPFLPPDTTKNCYGGMCIVGSFGNVAYIYLPVIGAGIWTPNSASTGAQNIIDRIDVYLNKVTPFALSYPLLKLDAEGPKASPLDVLNTTTGQPCVLKFGVEWDEFLTNCVRVTGDQTKDDTEQNKMFGGFMHGREQYHFALNGLTIDFNKSDLAEDKILSDEDRPKSGDISREWTLDQSLMGKIVNDRKDNVAKGPRDNHGMGLVYLEYARIVQAEINKFLIAKGEPTHELGDPDCLEPNVDPLTDTYPNGCTGMEGFVTCAPFIEGTDDPMLKKLSQGYDPNLNGGTGYPKCGFINTDMQPGLKPGHPPSTFCSDPVDDPKIDDNLGIPTEGFTHCISGDLWATSFARVLHVFGHDNLDNMPYEVRDTRFFFHAYMEALIKYFTAVGAGQETIIGVHDSKYSYDDLHFDSAGAGQWETAAYIDRRFVTNDIPPVEFSITADIKNGIFNDYEFVRQLYRGEYLLYTAVDEDKTNGLGKESSAQLTNIFGSPVLRDGWVDTAYRKAYQCATINKGAPGVNWDEEVKLCDGQTPPMNPKDPTDIERDEDGMPILYHYKGAFVGNATAFALRTSSPMKVDKIQENIASANFTMPVYENPYSSKTTLSTLTKMVPFEPKQPGIGFNIPVNGQLDRFLSTYHCDLSGRTISLQLAWDWTLDPVTMQPKGDGQIDLMGLHADDFLGDVFLCQDSATGDLLKARMYTTTDYLLDWMIKHPKAVDDCEIIIRYSPFGNYPDYISSLKNGVMMGVNQGGGKGRIIDAQMWIPGL